MFLLSPQLAAFRTFAGGKAGSPCEHWQCEERVDTNNRDEGRIGGGELRFFGDTRRKGGMEFIPVEGRSTAVNS